MKVKDAHVLIVPGYTNSGPDHWQSRWSTNINSATRIQQSDWHKPVVEEWVEPLIAEIENSHRPIVVVAHSLGCQVMMQSLKHLSSEQLDKIKGAFLVAPPDVENPNIRPRQLMTFGPYPRDPLPFSSITVASRNDPFCSYEVAGDMANAWGSFLVDAGESGHINSDSGHGPWPEGLMVFAKFMAKL